MRHRCRGGAVALRSLLICKAAYVPASGTPGGQPRYSDVAIETELTVRSVYHLGLPQTEGFLRSVSTWLGPEIHVPDHSTLSRRSRGLAPVPLCPGGGNGPIHILIDSTGLKAHRGPEPRAKRNRRQWRKLHVVVDGDSGDIVASEIATRGASGTSCSRHGAPTRFTAERGNRRRGNCGVSTIRQSVQERRSAQSP